VTPLVICLFLQSLQVSTADTITQGIVTAKVQEMPVARLRTDLLAFVWSGGDVGALVAVFTSGMVITWLGPKYPYLFATAPAAFTMYLSVRNGLKEKLVTSEELRKIRQHFRAQWETTALCLLIFVCSVALVLISAVTSQLSAHIAVAAVVTLMVLICFSVLLSPTIASMSAFNFIFSVLSLSTEAASFYFFTDSAEEYPEGPHLSVFFYSTVRGAVQFVFALIGIYSYQRLSQGWTYRSWMLLASFAFAIANIGNVLIFRRVNLSWGISDRVWLLGCTAITSCIDKWKWMPRVVSISYMSPKGMEVSMFALLMGCNNLGWSISSQFGALLLHQLGVTPSGAVGESARFQHLWLGSAWLSAVLPIVTLVLLPLLPKERMDESLVGEGRDMATAGSLWRRWTRRARKRQSGVRWSLPAEEQSRQRAAVAQKASHAASALEAGKGEKPSWQANLAARKADLLAPLPPRKGDKKPAENSRREGEKPWEVPRDLPPNDASPAPPVAAGKVDEEASGSSTLAQDSAPATELDKSEEAGENAALAQGDAQAEEADQPENQEASESATLAQDDAQGKEPNKPEDDTES
jgi:hypothetical protein